MRYLIITICLLLLIIGVFISNIKMEIYFVSGLCILLIINQYNLANSISNRKIPGDCYINRTQVTIKEKYLNIVGIVIVSTYYFFSSSFDLSLFIFFVSLLSLWIVNSVVYNIRKPWVLAINGNLFYLNKERMIIRDIVDISEVLKSSLSDELIIKFKKNSDEICIPIYWFDKSELSVFLQKLEKCSNGRLQISANLQYVLM